MNCGMRFVTLYRRQWSRPFPRKRKAKWLSEKALQIAVKRREVKSQGEKERYKHLNAEFQRIARRDKKAFFSNQCKEIEEKNRMGKTRDLFKKIRDTKGTFHAKMGSIKDRNGTDLTEAEDIKKSGKIHRRTVQKRSSMYSCHLFLMSSASVSSIPFLSFIEPIFAWNVPLVSLIFLKRSLVFPILLFSTISLHWSLKKAFYLSLLFFGTLLSDAYIFPFLLCFSLPFFSQLFVRPPQTAILLFCISFPWGWSWSLSPIQCQEPLSIVHQALCLRSSPLNLFLTSTV